MYIQYETCWTLPPSGICCTWLPGHTFIFFLISFIVYISMGCVLRVTELEGMMFVARTEARQERFAVGHPLHVGFPFCALTELVLLLSRCSCGASFLVARGKEYFLWLYCARKTLVFYSLFWTRIWSCTWWWWNRTTRKTLRDPSFNSHLKRPPMSSKMEELFLPCRWVWILSQSGIGPLQAVMQNCPWDTILCMPTKK